MSESVLKSILEDYVEKEWNKYDSDFIHVFSRKHNHSMKQIFKLYEKNTKKLYSYETFRPVSRIRFTKRTVIMLLLIVFLATIAGCAVAYFISNSFRGEVHDEYTKLFIINTNDCPQTIEEIYYISEIPKDFQLIEKGESEINAYFLYSNGKGKDVFFNQYVKTYFVPQYNTEYKEILEIDVGDSKGIFIDFSDSNCDNVLIAWDNGDYVLEISGDLSKSELLNLAKSAEVYLN